MKIHLGMAFILLMVILMMAAEGDAQFDSDDRDCSGDYSPFCTCTDLHIWPKTVSLTCNVSKNEDFDVIRMKLNNVSSIRFTSIRFVMTASLDIPEDIMGSVTTNWLELSCSDRSIPLGRVHPNAFKTANNDVRTLIVDNCDLTKTSFSFLSQFTAMTLLRLTHSTVKEVLDMPYLPKLDDISFFGSTNMEKWYKSSQTPNLWRIYFGDMPDLDDSRINSILSSMTEDFIYPNLTTLLITKNKLTRVPPLASVFPALSGLQLGGNPIKTLAAGSVQKGSSQLGYLNLAETELTTIEPGAFVGDFSSTGIALYDNPSMTSFPSAAFKDLLKSMVNSGGYVDIGKNPITYDCNLNWLLVDNRDLLPYVRDGVIADGTPFKDLNPKEKINC